MVAHDGALVARRFATMVRAQSGTVCELTYFHSEGLLFRMLVCVTTSPADVVYQSS